MAQPTLPTVPEVRYENITGEQLAVDLAALPGPTEAPHGNQQIDAALGILPAPENQPNEERTASASAGLALTPKLPPVWKSGFPVESLHLMNETLMTHRLSRNGPVNREVSAALTRMDFGKQVTAIWQRLDGYVAARSEEVQEKIDMDDNEKVGLAEAVYRREGNDDWAPILSLVIPGTRSGGLSGCRFEHPDESSNGPMSSLRLRMNSLGITPMQNGPHECMVETAWYALSKSERMFLTKGDWHIQWIDLSQFPCHQLNGSFCGLTALRKTVQWFCQGCFDENAAYDGLVLY
ncbi:unnamed protein product [Symbiodinium sp. CCMP2592]|nr:unnamed protein product [Symbiodinium sp. CCMP2592]